MLIIKGFIALPNFVNNEKFATNVVGELTNHARTYSKDQTTYVNHTLYGDVELVSFLAQENGIDVRISSDFSNHILTVSQLAHELASTEATLDSTEFQSIVWSTLGSKVSELIIGGWITTSGGKRYPKSLTWTYATNYNTDNRITVWFANDAFISEFDSFQHVVVRTFDADDLFLTYSELSSKYTSTQSQKYDLINEYNQKHTFTKMVDYSYVWTDRLDPELKLTLSCVVLIHGAAGFGDDQIKRAVQDDLLNNSIHSKGEWFDLAPDLFRNNEFILIPTWDNSKLTSGIQSGVLDINRAVKLADMFCPFYSQDHVDGNIELVTCTYRYLPLVIVAGDANIEEGNTFTKVHSTYIPVGSESPDFGKMAPDTGAFALKLNSAMVLAESLSQFTPLPSGYGRVERDGLTFITFSANFDIEYYVLTRVSYNSLLGV